MTGRRQRSEPLVSVIIPTYNRPEHLEQAVESVRDQTYPNVELIVVDDHSPTPAADTLGTDAGAADELQIIRHETNRGANAARNTGIEAANGPFVAFLDDDDEWLPVKLERQVARFREASDEVGVVYTGSKSVDENGDVIWVSRPSLAGNVTKELLTGALVGSFSRVMVRASVIDEAGGLDERFQSWQDREWYLRLSQHCQFAPIADPLVVSHFSTEQISDDYESKRDVSYPTFLEKHRDLAAEYGPSYERRFVATLSLTLGASGLRNGYYRDGIRYLLKSIRYYPLSVKPYVYLGLGLGGGFTYRPAKRLKRMLHRYTNTG